MTYLLLEYEYEDEDDIPVYIDFYNLLSEFRNKIKTFYFC